MTSCILTVIKNEHEYLDEWIQYHLDLGIDHIFIFEDIDSDSHKEITDKYGKRVSLLNIFDVLNDSDRKIATELKITKKWNVQHIYLRNSILYIKENYKYDWCFVIDSDEFITLEPINNLLDVLSLYNDYDAFVMYWKCYGANGYINKPSYNTKGVIDTYTQEIGGRLPDKIESLFKTCYNLNKYRKEFFFNQHHPTNICDWCNTTLDKKQFIPSYKCIYIRHYITRSWEEYVWKRLNRGFTWGGTRGLDVFFKINPDMKCMKDELINNLNI